MCACFIQLKMPALAQSQSSSDLCYCKSSSGASSKNTMHQCREHRWAPIHDHKRNVCVRNPYFLRFLIYRLLTILLCIHFTTSLLHRRYREQWKITVHYLTRKIVSLSHQVFGSQRWGSCCRRESRFEAQTPGAPTFRVPEAPSQQWSCTWRQFLSNKAPTKSEVSVWKCNSAFAIGLTAETTNVSRQWAKCTGRSLCFYTQEAESVSNLLSSCFTTWSHRVYRERVHCTASGAPSA